MNVAKFAVSRPITVWMAVFVAVLLGFFSLTRLPIDLLPEMNIPIAAVATSYEGAGPQEVESLVTRPIEEAMSSLANVTGVSSTSTRGQSVVLVEFDWGTDMNFAALEMRERIDLIRELLPDGAGSPRILRFDPSASPIMQLGMGGDRSLPELYALAQDVVKNRLERIEGVASVSVFGGREQQVHVTLDPVRMRAFNVSFETVVQALQAANLNLPGGNIVSGREELTLRTTGEFHDLADIAAVRIPTAAGTIPLREIAEVSMGESDERQITRLNRQPALNLQIVKETGANSVQVARQVREVLDEIARELGDVEFVAVYDESAFVEAAIDAVTSNAAVGALLAALVLYAFLRSFRSTLVIAISIPVSIVFTFLLVYFSGMTLNMLSLGGLALGVGMLVDNSIVVLENIFRHRQLGSEAVEAAVEGAREVAGAILASTLTTVAVFVPIVFMEGLASQIFSDLSLTVTYSLAASLAVAMTVVPLLASRLLANDGSISRVSLAAAGTGTPSGPERPAAPAGGLLGRVLAVYDRLIRLTLRRRGWTLLAFTAALAASLLWIGPKLGTEFLPAMDEGQFRISVEMPKGTKLAETQDLVAHLEEALLRIPEVSSILSQAGDASASDSGAIMVQLKPLRQRRRSTADVIEDVRRLAAGIPGANIEVHTMSFVGVGGAAPVQVQVRGDDLDVLAQQAARLAEVIRTIPGTREVRTSLDESRPELEIRIDRERAGQLGLSVVQIASSVRTAIAGQTATIYRSGGEEFDVVVRLAEPYRQNLSDLRNLPIGTPFGIVPLSEVAELVEARSPLSIDRVDQSRVVAVTAQLSGRALGSVMNDVRAAVAQMEFPPGVEVAYGGEDELMVEAFSDLGIAFVLSIVLVFAVLASQFESFTQPLVIIGSIPFALIGVVWGLYLTGHTFSVVAFIGVIMLVGIVVNNAILLIDFINQARRRGVDRLEAVVESGKIRLRPILMTTLTTVLGMLPLALGIGEGSELEAPLAVVVSVGLSTSTLLTLLLVPAVYLAVDDLTEWFRRVRRARSRTVGKEMAS